jgi:hypothetical protein
MLSPRFRTVWWWFLFGFCMMDGIAILTPELPRDTKIFFFCMMLLKLPYMVKEALRKETLKAI